MKQMLLMAIFVVCISGCSDPASVVCTRDEIPGLAITVLDSASSEFVHAEGILVTATDGAFSDSVVVSLIRSLDNFPIPLAWERAGTYTVTVQAPGYREWSQSNVRVAEAPDGCHVVPVNLTARLQRQ